MLKLTTLCSAISLALLASCGTSPVKNFSQEAVDAPVFYNNYFADATVDYVYKAQITVYGKQFGGIFIAKKVNDTMHRTVFTTEFGNTLFDFEISPNRFHVNSILEALDKKIIVGTLQRDFRLLLQQQHNIDQQFVKQDTLVYQATDGKRYNYLFTSKSNPRLLKLVHSTKSRDKIIIGYFSETSTLADKIIIDHRNIKLRIELNRFTDTE